MCKGRDVHHKLPPRSMEQKVRKMADSWHLDPAEDCSILIITMSACCRCNGSGRCTNCSCKKAGRICINCLPSRKNHCGNQAPSELNRIYPGRSSSAENRTDTADDLERTPNLPRSPFLNLSMYLPFPRLKTAMKHRLRTPLSIQRTCCPIHPNFSN